ncbi:MAG: GerMN domain-containing protein [Candidatus Aminicenantes bacterium]|nr:GerMN domain-containing protein [Candidatus Aminicenantes bacterium]
MPRRRILVLVVLGLTLVLAAVLFFLRGGWEKPWTEEEIPVSGDTAPPPGETEMKKVLLFFPSEADELLHPEEREIVSGPTVEREARRLVEELINGSRTGLISPIPPESQLRQLFITREGTAVVDFSKEFGDRHPSGTSAEMATVFCLVNSLTRNFSSIKRVFILVNGNERETLNGHISLAKPFPPASSLIAE